MIAYMLLVPAHGGTRPLLEWETETARLFGGFTRGDLVSGVYLNADKCLVEDFSRRYEIAVEYHREGELLDWFAMTAAVLGESAVYWRELGEAGLAHARDAGGNGCR